jgi:hypothetical protein
MSSANARCVHAYKVLGKLPITAITRPLVLDVLKPLWAARKVTTGKRLRAWVEAIIAYAVAKEYRADATTKVERRPAAEEGQSRAKAVRSRAGSATAP